MHRTRTFRAATLPAALVVLAAIAGCAGTPAPSPTPASTATPSLTAAPSPTAAPSGPRPLRMGTLPAGDYITNSFNPAMILTLPEGWSLFFPDNDSEVFMGNAAAELAIGRAAQVVDPVSREPVDAPEDLLEWLTQHPAFGGPEPVAIQLGGVDANYVDLPGPATDTKIFHFPGGDFHIPPGVATRFYVLPQEGLDISFAILPNANGGTIEAAIDAAHPIVASVQLAE